MNEQSIVLKALGLVTAYNTLDTPPGTFLKAQNIEIRREGVVEKRRGFDVYGTNLGGYARQLMTYQNRILRHFGTILDFDSNDEGKFLPFDGTYSQPDTTHKIRNLEYNGNLYFTSADGIQKISASSAEDLIIRGQDTGFITPAGGAKALDMSGEVIYEAGNNSGWFLADSAVAYRYTLTKRDANNIPIQGTVSQRLDLYNYLINLIQRDYNNLLVQLDNVVRTSTTLIGDASLAEDNYSSDPISGAVTPTDSVATTRTHLLALGVKLDDRVVIAENSGSPELVSYERTSVNGAELVFSTAMENYLAAGDVIISSSYTGAGATELNNNKLTVSAVSTVNVSVVPTIDFTTTDGAPVADTAPTIKRSKYSNEDLFPQPSAPSITPTNSELIAIQEYLQSYIVALQTELQAIISSTAINNYLIDLTTTTTATTRLDLTLPEGLTTEYYVQLYRTKSSNGVATDTSVIGNLTPVEELQLSYEVFLSEQNITDGYIIIDDITPDSLLGAFLYTNENNGETILQNNTPPPLALDMALFKNYIFYSNTRTKHKRELTLVGVSQMVQDYNDGDIPKLFIVNSNNDRELYSFTLGVAEETSITTVGDSANSLNGTYFLLNAGEDEREYYIWYSTGAGVDPAIAGKTGIKVNIDTNDSAAEVARKTASVLNAYNFDFIIDGSSNPILITNTKDGYTTAATAGDSGFTVTVTEVGQGQDADNNEILLSSNVSPAIAIDETARSLTEVLNRNLDEILYVDYLFDPSQPPGKMSFEAKTLDDYTIYFVGNNENTGSSFVTDISPLLVSDTLVTVTTANGSPTITTSANHGLVDGDYVIMLDTGTALMDGYWKVDNTTLTTFEIGFNASDTTSTGSLINSVDAVASDDERKVNRVYYSKLQQPEAVPIVNYLDIGFGNKAIQRMIALSNSLYIFKEDGIFQITGEVAPFSVSLRDPSSIIIANETASVLNGSIYYWSRQGINRISDSGIDLISQGIDNIIKRVSSRPFTSFQQTWGMGYESDNTYYLGVPQENTDTRPTILYKFCSLTDTWTTLDRQSTCGIVHPTKDVMYIGASDISYIEQERKNLDRTDFADRQYDFSLQEGLFDQYINKMVLSSIQNIEEDDVLVQEQSITVYIFNRLLEQLDTDPSVPSTNYYSTLKVTYGSNMRESLVALATKLDSELTTGYSTLIANIVNQSISIISSENPSVVTSTAHGLVDGRVITINGSDTIPNVDDSWVVSVIDANNFTLPLEVFTGGNYGAGVCTFSTDTADVEDLQACYNAIINKLNSDPLVEYNNYSLIDELTTYETLITNVDIYTNGIKLMNLLPYVTGIVTVYKQIKTDLIYNALTFGDSINYKHLRETQLLFINKAFTKAVIGFNSDLVPAYFEHAWYGSGNGIFGLSNQFGANYFGGASHAAPYRTSIPRDYSYCRFIRLQFKHNVARETFIFFGATITGNTQIKERAYR